VPQLIFSSRKNAYAFILICKSKSQDEIGGFANRNADAWGRSDPSGVILALKKRTDFGPP
jgi:hypothetical protein